MGPPRFDFTDLEDEDFELLCFLVVLLDFPDAERLRPPDDGADAGLEGTPGQLSALLAVQELLGDPELQRRAALAPVAARVVLEPVGTTRKAEPKRS